MAILKVSGFLQVALKELTNIAENWRAGFSILVDAADCEPPPLHPQAACLTALLYRQAQDHGARLLYSSKSGSAETCPFPRRNAHVSGEGGNEVEAFKFLLFLLPSTMWGIRGSDPEVVLKPFLEARPEAHSSKPWNNFVNI